MSLEDDMQEEDGGDVPYLDSEKTESDKKLNDNKDDEFVRIKKRTEEERKWKVVNEHKETTLWKTSDGILCYLCSNWMNKQRYVQLKYSCCSCQRMKLRSGMNKLQRI